MKKKFIIFILFLIDIYKNNNSILLFNIVFVLTNKSLRFGYDKDLNLFFLNDHKSKHYFSNKIRGVNLYSSGLKFRAAQIADSYKIKKLRFKRSDKVIDCGANYGDLWLFLFNKIDIKNYICFEPGENEYRALKQNVQNKNIFNLGLDNKESKKSFFVNEKDADSSIIEPLIYQKVCNIKTTTLNKFFKTNNIKKIKLLKLEAEGYEPEILKGSNQIINKIEYIAIDGGYERGKNLEETLSEQLNFLLRNNFEILEINLNWGRALLKNKKFY